MAIPYNTDMYPVRFSVEYPEEPRNRLTTLVRLILVIPIIVIIALIYGVGYMNAPTQNCIAVEEGEEVIGYVENYANSCPDDKPVLGRVKGPNLIMTTALAAVAAPSFSIAIALMILFRKKYPRWWFDFLLELVRFSARLGVYMGLLRDEYPSTDEHQSVTLDIAYPDAETQLNRWLPLVKWLLAIPHYIVLTILGFISMFVVLFSWVVILVTGSQPRWLFDYLVGLQRWSIRVQAYAFLMTTDRYPPFRFGE